MDFELSPQADKFLKKLSKSNKQDVRRILDKIHEITINLYSFEYLKKEGKRRKGKGWKV